MDTPLVDDLTLLLLNPETGRPLTDATRFRAVQPGAVLLELALRERLEAEPGRWGGDEVRVHDASPTGDVVLDEALRRLGDRPTAARAAVQRIGGNRLGKAVQERMAARGLTRHEPGGFLRFGRDHPDSGARKALVAEVASAPRGGVEVTPHAAALVSLLQPVGAIPKVVPELGLSRRQLADRVQRIADGMAEGEWAGEAVSAAVRSAQAAVTTAIIASTVVATSGTN